MGTYTTIVLKNKTDAHIKQVNGELEKLGYKSEVYNHVNYGAFISNEQLKEDVRFMNEDEEGLKQCPHMKRPLSVNTVNQFSWMTLGHYVTKLSSSGIEDLKQTLIVSKWAIEHLAEIEITESKNYTPEKIRVYLSYYDE